MSSAFPEASVPLVDPDEPGRGSEADVLDTYFDQAAELMMLYRPGDDRYRFSASWERVLGWTRDEIRSLDTPLDLVHPDDIWSTATALVSLIEDHVPLDRFEHRLRTSAGVHRAFQWNGVWLPGPQLVMATARDVTEMRRAIKGAQLAADRLRAGFEELPLGTFVLSLEPHRFGRFVRVNKAFCELTGYSRDELLSMAHDDLMHPDDRGSAIKDEVEQQVLAGQHAGGQFEMRQIRADGAEVWVRLTASVVSHQGVPHHAVAYVEDVTEARRAVAELARRAMFDDVTGLANRHRFMDHLQLAIDKLDRRPSVLALVYIDLDRFKQVNDTIGHEAGDLVLAEMGRRLSSTVRNVDTAARLAGDEFVVVCPDVDDPGDVVRIAGRFCTALRAPVEVNGRTVDVGASIGVAVTTTASISPSALLHQADTAMYHAKQRGGSRWELYNDHLHRRALERLSVEQELHSALDDQRFRLDYQPVVDLTTGRIVGAEALLRLVTPSGLTVAPADFLDVAEASDLIGPIGDWVLAEACRQGAEWNRRFGPLRVAINVSARQLESVRPGTVAATLARTGLAPGSLTIELSERTVVDLTTAEVIDLEATASLGVHLSIDDFGTGPGSITALRRLPVDQVKIDGALTAALAGPHDQGLVEAVAATARTLQLDLVAEGVENADQVEVLKGISCGLAQGYHLHHPASPAAVTALLASQH